MHQKIALQLRDARPILHVFVFRRIDAAVLGRQGCDGALHVADRRHLLIHPQLIVLGKVLFQRGRIFHDHVEDAALPVDPPFFAAAKKTVEETIRQHLGGSARSKPVQLMFR